MAIAICRFQYTEAKGNEEQDVNKSQRYPYRPRWCSDGRQLADGVSGVAITFIQ